METYLVNVIKDRSMEVCNLKVIDDFVKDINKKLEKYNYGFRIHITFKDNQYFVKKHNVFSNREPYSETIHSFSDSDTYMLHLYITGIYQGVLLNE